MNTADASDRLLLDTFVGQVVEFCEQATLGDLGTRTVVVGERTSAITLTLVAQYGFSGLRVYQDELTYERQLERLAASAGQTYAYRNLPFGEQLFKDAKYVLLRLPKSLDALREISDAVARWASRDVRVFAVGRVKHMTLGMNEVLGQNFATVSAGLARQKSRVLFASAPLQVTESPPFPVFKSDSETGFELASFGATFGGSKLDHGTRFLLSNLLPSLKRDEAQRATTDPNFAEDAALTETLQLVDLGCGNGTIATAVALTLPKAKVIATDQNRSAVAATRLTVARAGVQDRVCVVRADGCEAIGTATVDAVLLNPPFHDGTSIDQTLINTLLRGAYRCLKPGGELWLVMNAHLRYQPLVREIFDGLTQVARNNKFIILRARKQRSDSAQTVQRQHTNRD